ncbi:DfsB family protein [Loktanella sp. D2R18]|uniref:ClbS/DfsB family four-helix bundle protein n=1 Tax=Rhodobacterales TaxID=204455 RepID=UPI000DE975C5|nr:MULTISPECIES: ClbS/DfsB family four-helix bundle protein [Rhodobacterales]MDO6589384.1 ClbS/DfsB family four-helix bundle protein [Yoonia sp. 1_MG-2023]RBW45207.1 DfsB family protein [Loktanella sp. D2R18]
MAATTKTALLEISQKEFAKLSKLVGAIDANMAMRKGDEDTSIKDVIAHRAHWISLFLGWYANGQAGKAVFFPAEGYKWNDLKRYNADLRQRQSDLDWSGAKSALVSRYDDLIVFITSKSEAELYGGPMKGANNKWTPGRWAEAAGPSHFRSAAKFLRAELRSREL